MCWEKSRIPELIWKAGDSNSNVIEILHSDVNREGVHCSLVGGVSNGRHYDTLKMKSLDVCLCPFPLSYAIDLVLCRYLEVSGSVQITRKGISQRLLRRSSNERVSCIIWHAIYDLKKLISSDFPNERPWSTGHINNIS